MYATFSDLWIFWMGSPGKHFVPGVAIPAIVSAAGLLLRWGEIRHYTWPILLCSLANIPYVLYQAHKGWGGGQHLFSFFTLFVLLASTRRRAAVTPLAAFTCAWLSLVAVDVVGAYAQPRFGGILEPLTWIGGAGWLDGLLIFPTGTAAIAAVLPLIFSAKSMEMK